MSQRSHLQNAAFVMAGQLGARLLALVLYAILARALGTEYYGDIGLGLSFGVIASVVLEPGLTLLVIRDGSHDARLLAERAGDSLSYKLSLVGPVWLAMGGVGWAMGYRGSTLQAIWLTGGAQLLVMLEDLAGSVLVAHDRMDLEGLLRVTSKLLFSIAGLGALAARAPFPVVLGAMTLAQAVTAAVGMALVRRTGLRLSVKPVPERILALLKLGWPLAIAGVLWQVTIRLDQVLCSQLGVSRGELGDYNGAVKLVEALILFPNAVVTTFTPVLARAWRSSVSALSSELRVLLEAAFMVTLPIVVGGALLARELGTLVYGDRFAGVGPLLAIQLFALLFMVVQFSTFITLVAAGSLRGQSVIVGANLLVNVVANFILVPRLGAMGASISAIAGGFAAAVVSLIALRQLEIEPGLFGAAWRPTVAALGMAAVVWQVRAHAGFYAALVAGGVTYVALFLLLGGRSTVDALRTRRSLAHAEPVPEAG